MSPVRVKICGVMTPEAGVAAAEAGADAIGLILVPGARRQVTIEQARGIIAALPPFVPAVGVFVNAPLAEVEAAARKLHLGAVQLHGDEPPESCTTLRRMGFSVIKAVSVGERLDRELVTGYPDATAILLDTKIPGLAGGTGRTFPWETAVGLSHDVRLLIAGGLSAGNVTAALDLLQPYGVDVTSGVETDGRKDPAKIRAFIGQVRAWERRPADSSGRKRPGSPA